MGQSRQTGTTTSDARRRTPASMNSQGSGRRVGCRSRGPGCAPPMAPEFTGTEVMGRMTLERMLAGLSSRHYPVGLEPVGQDVEASASSTSGSAVSRKFVKATETALTELLAADLSGLDLVALMVDGVHFAEHCCVVALGIDAEGTKHPAGARRWLHGEHHLGPQARHDHRRSISMQGSGDPFSRGLAAPRSG